MAVDGEVEARREGATLRWRDDDASVHRVAAAAAAVMVVVVEGRG